MEAETKTDKTKAEAKSKATKRDWQRIATDMAITSLLRVVEGASLAAGGLLVNAVVQSSLKKGGIAQGEVIPFNRKAANS